MTQSPKHRLPDHVVERLQDAIKSAKLTSASFDGVAKTDPKPTITVTYPGSDYVAKFEGTVTDFIREKVRLHHGSWIVHPLEAILEWSLSTDDGSMREYDLVGRLTGPWPNPEVLTEAAKEVATLQEENAELRAFKSRVEDAMRKVEEAAKGLAS